MTASRSIYDVLILGCGISGLSAAITAAERGLDVAVVTKEEHAHESNTWYAQGGIVETGEGDSPELLAADIIRAGNGLNNVEAVRFVVEEGPRMVRDYLVGRVGAPFCRGEDGGLDRTREGAHSVRRIIHVKDQTGRALEEALLAHVLTLGRVHLFAGHTAIDLITNSHNSVDAQERYRKTVATGAYVLNNATGAIVPVFAGAIILATGGLGSLFLHTSNPRGATGDGIAMARRAGAEVINSEFVQFHPTILYHRDVKRFLITEALRGEGARLRNRAGDYFMPRYNEKLQDLAPRDEVARAIYQEMGRENSEYVFLDATTVSRVSLEERFPNIYRVCGELGIDIGREAIPVVPAAHYFCGGIKVDLDGQTSIAGLYAVGECSCNGIHGANRLASVSLLESLSFGVRCGTVLAKRVRKPSAPLIDSIPDWIFPSREEEFDQILVRNDMRSIQSVMWNYVGISRNKKRIQRAVADLNYLSHRIENFYRGAKLTREIVELRNAVLAAEMVARAAGSNHRSIGCHYVEDGD